MPCDFRQFPTTSWPLVRRAGETVSENPALEQLLRRYLPALRAHLRRVKRIPADEAEALLQSFILDKVIQQRLIAQADQQRGRFRSFLLTVLDNYVRNALRRSRAEPINSALGGELIDENLSAVDGSTPDRVFHVTWARELLAQALQRMEQKCVDQGHEAVWEVFRSRLIEPLLHGEPQETYETLVKRLGLSTVTQAHNTLVTAKRMFHRVLYSVVAEYARDEIEVEEEIKDLHALLSKPRSRTHLEHR